MTGRVIPEQKFLSRTLTTRIALALLILLIFFEFPVLCGGHGHSHDEHPPSFKYSREANEHLKLAEHVHEHHHEHEPHVHKHHHHEHELHDHKHHHHKHEPHVHETEDPIKDRNMVSLWINAVGSTLLISAAPFLILFLVPLDNSKEKEPWLKIVLSFASGSLLGDAFLHLIPHALSPHSHNQEDSHSHSHSHGDEHGHEHGHDMTVGLSVLLGIITFLMIEKGVRLIKGDHAHSHSHGSPATKEKKAGKDNKSVAKKNEPVKDLRIAGYLNLAADFTHNFTDGLAIGASYLAGNKIGLVTTVTILFHEVPHEIGDFAILIQSGCSKKKAIWLQLGTALGAVSGTCVSLLAEGMGDFATSWILPFTAGGFIYIATVSVIPELLSDTKFWQSIKEIIALLFGVFVMVQIAQYE